MPFTTDEQYLLFIGRLMPLSNSKIVTTMHKKRNEWFPQNPRSCCLQAHQCGRHGHTRRAAPKTRASSSNPLTPGLLPFQTQSPMCKYSRCSISSSRNYLKAIMWRIQAMLERRGWAATLLQNVHVRIRFKSNAPEPACMDHLVGRD